MKTTHKTLRSVVVFMAVIGMMFGVFVASIGAQSDSGVVPIYKEGNITTCAQIADLIPEKYQGLTFDSGKLDTYDGMDIEGKLGPIKYTLTKDLEGKPQFLSFEAIPDLEFEYFVVAAIVKGGNGANIFVYNPAVKTDSGLYSPDNTGGNQAAISHFSFCYIKVPVTTGQWCSPGFWRQPQHLEFWPEGYAPEQLFSTYFPDYRTDVMTGVTLGEVLANPIVYQGKNMDAFNMVGDLLSGAHPDVNFDDTRYEDTCPLGFGD